MEKKVMREKKRKKRKTKFSFMFPSFREVEGN